MKKRAFLHLRNFSIFDFIKITGLSVGGLVLLITITLWLTPRPTYKEGFQNLKSLQTFAQSLTEMEPMSNNNTLKPEFDTYYKKFKTTWKSIAREKTTYLLSIIGLAKKPIFSPGFFKTLLESMVKDREAKNQTGKIICKIKSTENSKFIIFGNIQGAFHSFVRDLEKLKELGIIDDKLQITQQDAYVFFMGDVVSRSCYSMETLAAVVRFAQINPEKVIYLKGNHETANYWQEHTLKTELQIRASHLSQESIPLEGLVNKFFNTLPEAVYLTIPEKPNEFVRISDAGRTQSELLNENNFSSFLTDESSQPVSFTTIKEKSESNSGDSNIIIKAIFRGEKKRESFQTMEGLRFLAPDMDSVAWNILSCPTYVYQRAIKFHHDAFVIVSAHKNIDEWKIVLYCRDARSKDPFKAITYGMLSGIDIATNKQIERYKAKDDKEKKDKKEKDPKKKEKQPASLQISKPEDTQQEPQSIVEQPAQLTVASQPVKTQQTDQSVPSQGNQQVQIQPVPVQPVEQQIPVVQQQQAVPVVQQVQQQHIVQQQQPKVVEVQQPKLAQPVQQVTHQPIQQPQQQNVPMVSTPTTQQQQQVNVPLVPTIQTPAPPQTIIIQKPAPTAQPVAQPVATPPTPTTQLTPTSPAKVEEENPQETLEKIQQLITQIKKALDTMNPKTRSKPPTQEVATPVATSQPAPINP